MMLEYLYFTQVVLGSKAQNYQELSFIFKP